ncbi:MAG: hypothetical protein A3J79_08545 [Elusimicrobia bacterium RIFOXYB2_FULL_62_6]|nr:MAG: hypothetical protein A3J79_08545 [Elusimicrobia bacterium RIFOXYB2_FULL_62_6]
MTEALPTKFLPAEKAEPAELERHSRLLREAPIVADALDGMLNFTLILNRQRQAVFVNKALAGFLKNHGIHDPTGLRFGEISGCGHPAESAGGCGTTEACCYCGSAQAMACALEGKEGVNECRILSRKSGDELDLRIQARPFKYAGEDFLLISIADISDEKRRHVLERLFFHDIINTAGGVQGLISLMQDAKPEEAVTYVPAAANASTRLLDQILSQKDLAAAERGELQVKNEEVEAAHFLAGIVDLFKAHEVAKNKKLLVSGNCSGLSLRTDKTLLARVIGNMAKNALEAESPGAAVELSCAATPDGVSFTVRNPTPMPDEVRLQVFQRSFSTKGAGRGLGTYSIRLLTERYLKGKVSFASGPSGTVFTAEYPLSAV